MSIAIVAILVISSLSWRFSHANCQLGKESLASSFRLFSAMFPSCAAATLSLRDLTGMSPDRSRFSFFWFFVCRARIVHQRYRRTSQRLEPHKYVVLSGNKDRLAAETKLELRGPALFNEQCHVHVGDAARKHCLAAGVLCPVSTSVLIHLFPSTAQCTSSRSLWRMASRQIPLALARNFTSCVV